MKFLVDFPMTIYATEIFEADSKEEAKAIADKLLDSWEFFCERLYPDYQDCDLHTWENCDIPEVQDYDGFSQEVTLTAEQINDFIGE
jgi:hypothetical protein